MIGTFNTKMKKQTTNNKHPNPLGKTIDKCIKYSNPKHRSVPLPYLYRNNTNYIRKNRDGLQYLLCVTWNWDIIAKIWVTRNCKHVIKSYDFGNKISWIIENNSFNINIRWELSSNTFWRGLACRKCILSWAILVNNNLYNE